MCLLLALALTVLCLVPLCSINHVSQVVMYSLSVCMCVYAGNLIDASTSDKSFSDTSMVVGQNTHAHFPSMSNIFF